MMTPEPRLHLPGRILFLTRDPALLVRQLNGEDLAWDPSIALLDDISTDEIVPARACFDYDQSLANAALSGLRGGHVGPGTLRQGGFSVLVSGKGKGCGSSREQAPFAEQCAGIRLVIAHSFEKIYAQNCQNIGLFTASDFSLIEHIRRGEALDLALFTAQLDPLSAAIVRAGGLFPYNQRRLRGELSPPTLTTPPRPMTMAEKILARHAVTPTAAVAPGDALFVTADVRFSHEYVTPMAEALFVRALGEEAHVAEPESVFTFRDHLTLLGAVMPEVQQQSGLLEKAQSLARVQERFAKKQRLTLYGETARGGSIAICHNAVIEDLALPGQIVIGTDSHTCMAGALGCLAFGVGSTDMANAWYTRDVRVRVPESVRITLRGRLAAGVSAKDVMLELLRQPFFRDGQGRGRVLEFVGEGTLGLALDERATLTNMAVEAGGFTGIIEADDRVLEALQALRPQLTRALIGAQIVKSDPGARYAAELELELSAVRVMVATPGDPRNGVALAELAERPVIDIAYGGSCTGGKKADMDQVARVLTRALALGLRVASGVEAFLQFGSEHIRGYAQDKGYLEIFARAGFQLVEPSCGACINAGPGASHRPEQVTVSAINRNFPGRSGPGQVYLASPATVAASAIAGKLCSEAELFAPR